MKSCSFLHSCLLSIMMCLNLEAVAQTNIMVMSDMHVLDRSLFDSSSPFEGNSRIVEHSADLFDLAISLVSEEKPDLLLISGDLTHDGEKASHEYVANQLNAIVDQGIKVLVVPGNHDINNPNSFSYKTSSPQKEPTISAVEFSSIYNRCGYSDAIERHGLSYLAFPCDGLAIICLDSRKPDTESVHYSEGGLTEETLLWAEKMAKISRFQGRAVIGMMHHPIMEHFDGHAELAPTYIANQKEEYPDLKSVQQRLVNAGIGVMFTGHFHAQSIQHEIIDGKELWDVMTGSLSSYPMPVRKGSITKDGKVSFSSSDYIGKWQELGKIRNQHTTKDMFARLAKQLLPQIEQKKSELGNVLEFLSLPNSENDIVEGMNTYMLDSYTELFNSFSRGDEDKDSPDTKYNAAINGFNNYIKSLVLGDGLKKTIVQTLLLTVIKGMDEYQTMEAMNKSIFYNFKTSEDNVVADTQIDISSISPITIQDLNEDGVVDNHDIILMAVKLLLQTANHEDLLLDYDNDGTTVRDLVTTIKYSSLGSLPF